MNKYLAKSNGETIEQHTNDVLANIDILNINYPCIFKNNERLLEILKLACEFHDLGKMNVKFQNKVSDDKLDEGELKNKQEIPHGYLSPAFLDRKKLEKKYSKDELKILYQSIYYHHKRKEVKEELELVLNNTKQYADHFDSKSEYYTSNLVENYGVFVSKKKRLEYNIAPEADNSTFFNYVKVKGLLNRADYAASAKKKIPIEIKEERLSDKLNEYFKRKHTEIQKEDKKKSFKINKLQEYMLANRDNNIIVKAATGFGKTEGGLLWLGNSKGFFTLPLRVSINAIYDRVRSKKEINFKNTGLLHSDALSHLSEITDKNESDDVDYFYEYNLARNFSVPLTITTADQIFDFVFKQEGFELKLATLSYSKVIIDEIQMYSPDIVAYLIAGIKLITEAGGKFAIMTATFPKFLEELIRDVGIDFETPEKTYFKDELRHVVKFYADDSIESKIYEISNIAETKKVLVICNTVKKAQEIYRELQCNSKYLLHSRFIKKDRKELEDKIQEFAPNNGGKPDSKHGVWVTTQVVEASLDVDFDVLYTEMTSIDGLFQRMGRCYRSRKYKENEPNVHVFGKASGIGSVIDREIFDMSCELIEDFDAHKLYEKKKFELVDNMYGSEKIEKTEYYKAIKKNLNAVLNLPSHNDIPTKFRNIFTYTAIPIEVYEDKKNRENIDKWFEIVNDRAASKEDRLVASIEINKFTVSVPGYLKEDCHFKKKWYSKYNQIHKVNLKYDEEEGLISNEKPNNQF